MTKRDAVDGIQDAWARERPDLPVESIGIVTRIWRVGKLLEQNRRDLLKEAGTDQGTLDLLATLLRAGPPYELTPSELAARSLITSGGISQRLARAERAGLITRRPADMDGRSVIVSPTEAGRQLLDRTVGHLLRAEQEALGALDPAEREQLANLLRRLLGSLIGG